MSTRRRYDEKGHAHALIFTCYRRFPFLSKDRTREWFCEAVRSASSSYAFDVWAYVLMPDHVHLIVWPRVHPYSTSEICRAVKEPVGRRAVAHIQEHAPEWLPRITRTRGSRTERLFWQPGGGYDRNLTTRKTLIAEMDYLHLNPVRAGLVERASDWPWSSAAQFEGLGNGPIPIQPVPRDWDA